MIYLAGSLDHIPRVWEVAHTLRAAGHEVFDEWTAGGKDADRCWQEYEKQLGRPYQEALEGYHAKLMFGFDTFHIARASALVVVLPAGKSAHMEMMDARAQGKATYILLDGEPERFDLMYRYATKVVPTVEELVKELSQFLDKKEVATLSSPPCQTSNSGLESEPSIGSRNFRKNFPPSPPSSRTFDPTCTQIEWPMSQYQNRLEIVRSYPWSNAKPSDNG